MFVSKPSKSDYNEFYAGYISLVEEGDVVTTLKANQEQTKTIFDALSEEKGNYAYAPNKWTIKEVVEHLVDTERIFAYRFLRIYRGDATALPSYDQDNFVKNGVASKRTLQSLAKEFYVLREANLMMVENLDERKLDFKGMMSGNSITPRALLYIMAGHEAHHIKVLKERYL